MKISAIALGATAAIGGLLVSAMPSMAYDYYSTNTIGGTTFVNGSNSYGSYRGTVTNIGGTSFYNGYNSSGGSVSGSCTSIGSYISCSSY